jgi:hypothetical protein
MASLTPEERRRRHDLERLIRLAEPGLNLVLAIGDRISRVIEPHDHDYYPPRASELNSPETGRDRLSDRS